MAVDPNSVIVRLYKQYASRVRGLLYSRVRRREVADELAQEVFMRLLRGPDLSSIRNPEAYLVTVAGNLATEYELKERRERNPLNIDDPQVQEQISAVTDYAAELDTENRIRRYRHAVSELPAKCQDVVVLRTRYGLRYEEIARHLGISINMVKKYLSQALAHCRDRVAEPERSDD